MEATKLFEDEGEFQATESESKLKMLCHVKVPDDAKLDETYEDMIVTLHSVLWLKFTYSERKK